MSSILLSNPFVTPAPPPPQQMPGAEPLAALAVAPTQGSVGSGNAGNATGFSGNGSGFGSDSSAQTIIAWASQRGALERPTDAAPSSVLDAQAQASIEIGGNLPEVELPHILPTAHWFKSDD